MATHDTTVTDPTDFAAYLREYYKDQWLADNPGYVETGSPHEDWAIPFYGSSHYQQLIGKQWLDENPDYVGSDKDWWENRLDRYENYKGYDFPSYSNYTSSSLPDFFSSRSSGQTNNSGASFLDFLKRRFDS